MTPSDPDEVSGRLPRADQSAMSDVEKAMSAAMASLLDPAILERMANEFYTALPTQTATAPATDAAAPATAAAGSPAAASSASAPKPEAASSAFVPSPAVPGDLNPASYPGPPDAGSSFYFLDDAFALSRASSMGIPRVETYDVAPKAEAASPALASPSSASPSLASAPTLPGDLNATSYPGAPDMGSSFYFLDEARAFTRVGSLEIPRLETYDFNSGVVPDLKQPTRQFEAHTFRRDFPVLQQQVHGRPLIWLDNAATTQKPQSVIDRLSHFYENENSNIHRAAHALAARATDAYEAAREKVRRFLNASTVREIVFVRGATEAINLAAQSWGRRHVGKDDEIVITWLEHHSNIVPWQLLAAEKGARLRVAPIDDDGQVILDEYEKLLGPKTRIVSFAHVSNALGTVTPARQMVEMAHRYGAKVLVDGAQAVSHMPVDVQELDCDFYAFSGHKVFGPTGIGVLYGKPDILEASPPWHGGGNMITDVTFEKTTYQPPPARFEAGTGNIADAVGLGAAIDYVQQIGLENIARYEHELLVYGTEGLRSIPGLRLIGTAREKAGVLSFVLDGVRTEDVGAALDREGIAVRAGHHCAQPALRRFGIETSVRPSLALYNTPEDIDALVAAVRRLRLWGDPGKFRI